MSTHDAGTHEAWCGDYRVECKMAGVYNGPVPCICERRNGEERRRRVGAVTVGGNMKHRIEDRRKSEGESNE